MDGAPRGGSPLRQPELLIRRLGLCAVGPPTPYHGPYFLQNEGIHNRSDGLRRDASFGKGHNAHGSD